MTEYVVGRRVTRYETAVVRAGSRGEAVALARREGRFGGAFEEAEYDVLEANPGGRRGARRGRVR